MNHDRNFSWWPSWSDISGEIQRAFEFFKTMGSYIEKILFRPKYDGECLHKLIKEMVKDKRIHETLTNVIIPTFDIKRLQPVNFTTLKVYYSVHCVHNFGSMSTTMFRGVCEF